MFRAVGVPLAQLSCGGLGAAKALARGSEPLQAAISRHGQRASSPHPQHAIAAVWSREAGRWAEEIADCVWRRYERLRRTCGGIVPLIDRQKDGRRCDRRLSHFDNPVSRLGSSSSCAVGLLGD